MTGVAARLTVRAMASMTTDQTPNDEGFVKPGELINVRGGAVLTLHDRRVFNLLVEHAWDRITEDIEHRIPLADLRGHSYHSSERIGPTVHRLMTTIIRIPTTLEGQPAIFSTQLLGPTTKTIDENSPKALLVYSFPRGLQKIIKDSRYWGRIKAQMMFAFGSKYSLALYEALCLRANLKNKEQTFTLREFRAMLGVEPTKLNQFKNLKMRLLDPVQEEINTKSDFSVAIEPIRARGNTRGEITGFKMAWSKKEDANP